AGRGASQRGAARPPHLPAGERPLRVHGPREGVLPDDAPAHEARGRGMTRAVDRLLWPFLWAATLLFLAWGIVPRAAVFTSVLFPARLVALAGLVKLCLLAAGAAWSWRARGSLDAANPV